MTDAEEFAQVLGRYLGLFWRYRELQACLRPRPVKVDMEIEALNDEIPALMEWLSHNSARSGRTQCSQPNPSNAPRSADG